MKPGKKMDALVALQLGWHKMKVHVGPRSETQWGLIYLRKDQIEYGYPAVYIKKDEFVPVVNETYSFVPPFSTNDGDAMAVFNWMSKEGMVILCNGDGDSFDCDWWPQRSYWPGAAIRAMNGQDCESFAHAVCLALLVGTGKIEL